MGYYLRKVKGQWEVWEENEKHEMRSLSFLSPRTTFPPSFATFEELQKWLIEEEKKQAKNKALKLLAGRNYPTHLLYRKLVMKGFSDSVAQEIVELMQRLGYVQDSEYLRAVIRQEQASGHGPKAILWKLRAKGFPQKAIEQEMSRVMPLSTQKETIRKVIAKLRLSTAPSARQKTVMALLRRGFDIETINDIFKIRPNLEIVEME
jgi:SOS response regulatory protein OraA/RecX